MKISVSVLPLPIVSNILLFIGLDLRLPWTDSIVVYTKNKVDFLKKKHQVPTLSFGSESSSVRPVTDLIGPQQPSCVLFALAFFYIYICLFLPLV